MAGLASVADVVRCVLAGGRGRLPGCAASGEVLERSALSHHGVGSHDPGIALDERYQVEQAAVPRQAR